ncbi:protein ImpA [Haemophilus pittmaniae]|uniref:Protein ImpA n=2 Tax=Haemophilus pittmaniae TaxID=249188 RepID=A0A377J1A7_9PAST|nr:S24 family peptidase [Haemophilus pittmaniae]SNV80626.1 protein ImpA [Haemophilus pittmaniae]STO93567.1 protein ImpA [Haemophilus pittmaniae]
MNYANHVAQNDNTFSYHPMPFFNDIAEKSTFNKKLDLNLYCIKRPQQTCFVRVTNPNMLAWGIECGDMLVVEKSDELFVGDLIVLGDGANFRIYEFAGMNRNEFLFMSLDSQMANISIADWHDLPLVGTVTNCIHQMKPRRGQMRFVA